jgi:hypothetical protein
MAETETIGTNAGFNQAVRTIATCALPPGERGSKKEHATTLKVFFFSNIHLASPLKKTKGSLRLCIDCHAYLEKHKWWKLV